MKKVTTVGTVKKLHSFLGQAFFEAERKGILPRNPADWANVPQVAAKSRDDDGGDDNEDADSSSKAMEEREANAFLAAARAIAAEQELEADRERFIPERCWSALWHVLLGCGVRPGEALALKWTDVEKSAVQVRRNLVRVRGETGFRLEKPKTKKSRRSISLPVSVSKELMRWRTQQKRQRLIAGPAWEDLSFVFTTSKGTPLHGARRSFERVCAKAGLGEWGEQPKRQHATGPLPTRKFTPAFRIYELRHTCCSLLLANGVPVNVVADIMGHEKASFTFARYGHALKKDTQEAVVKLEGVLFGTG